MGFAEDHGSIVIKPSIITCIALSKLVRWLAAHQFKISCKLYLNTSNTDLQAMMQNIKFAACQTRPIFTNTRSSRSHMWYKIGVLKNLTKFKEKHLCWSLFSNQPASLWTKRLRHSNFSMKFAKCLRTPFLQNTSGRLLLSIAIYAKSI